jgi:hypothetical protein
MNQAAFGGGATETILNPIVLVAMLLAIALLFWLPRRQAIAPFLCIVFLVPLGQVVVLGGVHFTVLRIVILAGLVWLVRERTHSSKNPRRQLDRIDWLFISWAACRAIVFMLLWMQHDAVVNQCGMLVDTLGGYFVLRWLIQDEGDVVFTAKVFAALVAVIGMCMLYEQSTRTNVFGLLGGVRVSPEIRENRIRCQGVFQHSIVAGVFGGTLLPLFFWLWRRGKAKVLSALGMLGSACMVYTSSSSTPMLAALAGILGLCCWPIRREMRTVRISLVAALAGLALVMKAPVWFIIAHIDIVGSSSGYHRALLIDQFIRNFWDWWLLGVKDTGNWGYDLWDVQNQFVAEGEIGGLVTFVLFIMIVVQCFRMVGVTRRAVRGNRTREELVWTLGAVLFAHCTAFFGANYFDQIKIWWYAFVVMLSAMAAVPALQPETEAAEPTQSDILSVAHYEYKV